jgi:hypothetical protein
VVADVWVFEGLFSFRDSSNMAMSSAVMVMVVGLRRSILCVRLCVIWRRFEGGLIREVDADSGGLWRDLAVGKDE